jgi:predicted component of type VI protein secretion system
VSENRLLKIRLSLKGRPIRTYAFNQESVLIGRNPEADIQLDNSGISRDHLRIAQTPGGYVAEDQNSANGTFVNDAPIQKQHLRNEDVIRIGKFSLWVNLEDDRRGSTATSGPAATTAMGATTVLSTIELEKMIQAARAAEPAPPPEPRSAPGEKPGRPRHSWVLIIFNLLFALVLGTGIGMGTLWLMSR